MKRLVLLAALLLPAGAGQAAPRCPGQDTMEMRLCAGLSLEESNRRLQQEIPPAAFRQWRQTTQALCARAYASTRDGSIHPQLLVGCQDNLNRALLKEFEQLNNQG
ncbi:MAG: DUF1311 domain-containing protein [Synechococcaceae cyanobacterium]|nr:DUF1311 domain-containing protein [Synechococcaceae cyanobacterium]